MTKTTDLGETLRRDRDAAEEKAWRALSSYKFWMFGYWAAWWVKLNRLCPDGPAPNPWRHLVMAARHRTASQSNERIETKAGSPRRGWKDEK